MASDAQVLYTVRSMRGDSRAGLDPDRLSQPVVVPISDTPRIYVLTEPYTYTWVKDGFVNLLTVPRRFKCDLASTPRIVWSILGLLPDGLIRAAAVLHDFIYGHKGKLPHGSHRRKKVGGVVWEFVSEPWTRKQADKLFARVMREAGVSKRRRRLAYLAVRVFGWTGWR